MVFLLSALAAIPAGSVMVWQLRSGEAAHTTVVWWPSGRGPNCEGLWPPVGTPVDVIVVPNKTWLDEGSVVDVDHDGRTVRVKLIKCHVADDATIACTGVAPPPPDSVHSVSVGGTDLGEVIAVHVHEGPTAPYLTADADLLPYGILGLGCVMAVVGVVQLVQRRRRPIPPTGWVDPTSQQFRPL
jgi:hypothetical protein